MKPSGDSRRRTRYTPAVSRAPSDFRLRYAPSLEPRWQQLLDSLAASKRLPVSSDLARLGADLARLSAAYNAKGSEAPVEATSLLGARLAFSFPRDVPKAGVAVAELIAAGLLEIPADRALSMLDVGAGLGATTWGVVRALAAAGQKGRVDALLLDTDARALDFASFIAKQALGEGEVSLNTRSEARSLAGSAGAGGRHDLVILGQVLSEADRDMAPDDRAGKHAALIGGLLSRSVKSTGSLVIIEPALRDRTRHLHAVRNRLVGAGSRVFAPCFHAGACPMLLNEQDWCHEDMDIDLPSWLWPVARAAGLRWQGLTFSYLVIRPDGASAAAGRQLARIVAPPKATKGKHEHLVCAGQGGDATSKTCELTRLALLDREQTSVNRAFTFATRGEALAIEPWPQSPQARLAKDSTVQRFEPIKGATRV